MNNILLFSDLHITQSSLKECILILEEIGSIVTKCNVDTIIDLGDTFNSLKPSSIELDTFATFIRRVNKKIIILAANSHESETEQQSILNHYGILSNNVQIVKEFKDGNHLYCGHFSIKESINNYDAKFSKEDFKNYLYVFLGHIHSYQLIKPNIIHLGSSRYVSFDEVKDKAKIVALITDYGAETERVHFMKLKSPIPMQELRLSQKTFLEGSNDATQEEKVAGRAEENGFLGLFEGVSELSTYLGKIDPNTKVKIKILDFESFRQFLPLVDKYSNKFHLFKYETNFTVISDNNKKQGQTEINSFKESFINWLKNQKIDPQITEILQKEVE